MRQNTPELFIRRLRWLTFAVIAVLFVWHALSWADRAFRKESANPSPVTARGDLARLVHSAATTGKRPEYFLR
jgi:hypothetical protein